MEKERLVAVMAYNLVRAIMFQAAQRAKIDPRQLSFTYACNIVLEAIPKLWPPPPPTSNSRNSNVSSNWCHVAVSPNAPNVAPIRARCGVAAIVFPSGEGSEIKWHCALLRAASRLFSTPAARTVHGLSSSPTSGFLHRHRGPR
jgi:hypothetical protein